MKKKLSAIDIVAKEGYKGICDRCNKEITNWSGTPEFRICKKCFNDLLKDGSV